MKILILRKKIIINAILALILLGINGAVFFFYNNIDQASEAEIIKVEGQISNIKSRIREIEKRDAEIKRYKALWTTISEKRKHSDGIKVDDFNNILAEISKKYLVTTENVKINLPQVINQGLFKRETFDLYHTSVSMNYFAINDVMAISFVEEFINSLYGYPIIYYFDMSKSKPYSAQDLSDISSGKAKGSISGKLEFFWYVPKSLQQ
jgi:hypothetical protein